MNLDVLGSELAERRFLQGYGDHLFRPFPVLEGGSGPPSAHASHVHVIASNWRFGRSRFVGAGSTLTWLWFFAMPRSRVSRKPNCFFIAPKGCSLFLGIWTLAVSIRSAGLPSGAARRAHRLPGRIATLNIIGPPAIPALLAMPWWPESA